MATLTAPAFYRDTSKPTQNLGFVIAASSCGTHICGDAGGAPPLVADRP